VGRFGLFWPDLAKSVHCRIGMQRNRRNSRVTDFKSEYPLDSFGIQRNIFIKALLHSIPKIFHVWLRVRLLLNRTRKSPEMMKVLFSRFR